MCHFSGGGISVKFLDHRCFRNITSQCMFRMLKLAYISQSSDFDSTLYMYFFLNNFFLNFFIELCFEINLQIILYLIYIYTTSEFS